MTCLCHAQVHRGVMEGREITLIPFYDNRVFLWGGMGGGGGAGG